MPVKKSDDEIMEGILKAKKEQEKEKTAGSLKASASQGISKGVAKAAAKTGGSLQTLQAKKEEKQEQIYQIQAGDTLGKIAQTFYGDASRWKEIYEANKDKIANPDVIQVGLKIRIP